MSIDLPKKGSAGPFATWVSKGVESGGFATYFALAMGALVVVLVWLIPVSDRTPVAVAAVIQTGAVLIGLLSLVLIARQIRATAAQAASTAAVNSALAYHQYFGDLVTLEIRRQLSEVAIDCGFAEARKLGKPMCDKAVACIKANPEHDGVVSSYLDEFEEFCAAIHAKLLNEDYAYGLEATRIIRAWAVFGPFIVLTRKEKSDFRTYIELERVASSWTARRKREDEDEENAVRNRNAANGVKSVLPLDE
jgi:hypothetical protein